VTLSQKICDMQGDKTLLSCYDKRAKNRRYVFEKTKYSKFPYGPFFIDYFASHRLWFAQTKSPQKN
jgi:hypothetical protein